MIIPNRGESRCCAYGRVQQDVVTEQLPARRGRRRRGFNVNAASGNLQLRVRAACVDIELHSTYRDRTHAMKTIHKTNACTRFLPHLNGLHNVGQHTQLLVDRQQLRRRCRRHHRSWVVPPNRLATATRGKRMKEESGKNDVFAIVWAGEQGGKME